MSLPANLFGELFKAVSSAKTVGALIALVAIAAVIFEALYGISNIAWAFIFFVIIVLYSISTSRKNHELKLQTIQKSKEATIEESEDLLAVAIEVAKADARNGRFLLRRTVRDLTRIGEVDLATEAQELYANQLYPPQV